MTAKTQKKPVNSELIPITSSKTHEHEWVYSDWMKPTYPPIYTKICKICGEVVDEQANMPDQEETFDSLFQKFHGGKTFELQKPL